MRSTFVNELIVSARRNDRIFLLVGDLGYSVVEPFAEEFPDRFLNAGVAEQNMTGVAAGLASEGYHVFTYSIANFPVVRCLEQIRNDVCYHRLPVTVVAVGGGLAYGNLGYSHHAVQDYACLSCLPGMTICAPGDPMEVRSVVRYLSETPQPSYVRLGKNGEPQFHDAPPPITDGSGMIQHVAGDGNADNIFLSTGTALACAMEALDQLSREEWAVYSAPVWSHGMEDMYSAFLSKFRTVVSVEDHLKAGGFGGFLQCCARGDSRPAPKLKVAALDASVCGRVGSQQILNSQGGLSVSHLLRLALG